MVARYLEERGLPTLCLGSAYDILEAGRAPRSLFLDYPLGHGCGKPVSEAEQYVGLNEAFKFFETMSEPGEIAVLDRKWDEENWKAEASSTVALDTRQPRDISPQFQYTADREAAIASGAIPNE